MPYDPETYVPGTALNDLAPLTDAQIVLGLVQADTEHEAHMRVFARFLNTVLTITLQCDRDACGATEGLIQAFREAWDKMHNDIAEGA